MVVSSLWGAHVCLLMGSTKRKPPCVQIKATSSRIDFICNKGGMLVFHMWYPCCIYLTDSELQQGREVLCSGPSRTHVMGM